MSLAVFRNKLSRKTGGVLATSKDKFGCFFSSNPLGCLILFVCIGTNKIEE